jgi:hypothetical protein
MYVDTRGGREMGWQRHYFLVGTRPQMHVPTSEGTTKENCYCAPPAMDVLHASQYQTCTHTAWRGGPQLLLGYHGDDPLGCVEPSVHLLSALRRRLPMGDQNAFLLGFPFTQHRTK